MSPGIQPLESRQLLSIITEYPVTNGSTADLAQITAGLNSTLWYTESGKNIVGALTTSNPNPQPYLTLPAGSAPDGITLGPDGNLWFTETATNAIGVVNLTGTAPTPGPLNQGISSLPAGITSADGYLWFTQAGTDQIGRLDPANGDVTEFPAPASLSGLDSQIVLGSDGYLWFTEFGEIGVFDPNSGEMVTQVSLPGGSSEEPFGITVGPDGNVWYTAGVVGSGGGLSSFAVGKIDLSNADTVSEIPVSAASEPFGITAGPDGNIWFTVTNSGSTAGTIDVINPAMDTIIQTITIPTNVVATPDPVGITTGADGSIWFTDGGGAIGQVVLPTQLAVTVQPPLDVSVGNSFSVTVTDRYTTGVVDTDFNGPVTIAVASGPSNSLGGVLTVTAVNGVAAFNGLSLGAAGAYSLLASSSATNGPTSITTNGFNVVSGPATELVVTTEPPSPVTAGKEFEVAVTDEYVTGPTPNSTFSGSVSIALVSNPSVILATTTAVNGVAMFPSLALDKAGNDYVLQATSAGLAAVSTDSFDVVAAAPTQLVVTASPPASVAAGDGFGVSFEAEDPFDNVDLNFDGTVTVSVLNVPAGGSPSLGGLVSMSAVNGVAAFKGLTLTHAASGYTLQATSPGLNAAPTSGINVVAGAAMQLVVTIAPPASVLMGTEFSVTVAAEDQYNNVDPNFTGNLSIAVAPASNPGGSSLSGPTSVTASQGVAAFSGLSVNNPGIGYRLQISGDGLNVTTNSFNVTPPSPQIILAQVLRTQKRNKRGKPVGKPVFAGFEFQYSEAMSSSAGLASDYVVDMFVIKRIKHKNEQLLQPISFSPSYNPVTNTVTLTVSSKQKFPKGGQITVIGTPPNGVSNTFGVFLSGGANDVYTITKNGKGLVSG